MFPEGFCIHIVKIITKSLFLILNTYVCDVLELLWLFRPYLWLISQYLDTTCKKKHLYPKKSGHIFIDNKGKYK